MKIKPSDIPIKTRPLIFVDLETTGLDPRKHEIIQIGALVVSQPDFEVVKKWEVKVKPEHLETASAEALKMVNHDPKKWKEAVLIKQALEEFNQLAKDGMLIGYNISFDWMFLETNFVRHKIKPTFDYHCLDIPSMIFLALYKDLPEKIRLGHITKHFGLSRKSETHDALEDAELTHQIFKRLMNLNL